MPYAAKGLKHVPVDSYQEIEYLMKRGLANRTVSSARGNAAATSLAHTIAGIEFRQRSKGGASGEMYRLGVINLVDLAGTREAKPRKA